MQVINFILRCVKREITEEIYAKYHIRDQARRKNCEINAVTDIKCARRNCGRLNHLSLTKS